MGEPRRELPAGGVTRRKLWIVILALVALHAPSLGIGHLADDYVHELVLEGAVESDSLRPWNLYAFGSSAEDPGAFDIGGLLWFTSPDWKVRFFRPLTSLSLWLDHSLFGTRAWPQHLENLLLFGLLLGLAWRLLRHLGIGPASALLALLLFGADGSSVVPVGWIANRNSLLVALFQIGALLCLGPLDRRPTSKPIAAALACALLATLAKESGVMTFPLLAVRLLLGPRDVRDRRPWALALVAIALAGAYVLAWKLGGYGADSRFYPAPWEHPNLVAARAPFLALAGPLAAASPFALDLGFAFPAAVPIGCALGALLLLALARPLARALRGRRALGLLLLAWFALPLLPQAAAPPSDRLLFESALPAAIALALIVGHLPRRAAHLLLLSALVLPVISTLARQAGLIWLARDARTQIASAAAAADATGASELILLQTPNPLAALSTGAQARIDLGRSDLRLWPLQMGGRPLQLKRLDERSFELTSLGLPFLAAPLEQVFRSVSDPVAPGRVWTAGPLRLTALNASGDATTRLLLELIGDGPAPTFVTWTGASTEIVELPEPGEQVTLPAVTSPLPLGS